MAKKEYPMKHLQVEADVHEAVNMMKKRYGVDKLHIAIKEFIKDLDPDLLMKAQAVVDMRLGLDDEPSDDGNTKRRNVKRK
jgi:hypothetical protein